MLEFVAHYTPGSKEEVYDIMNALDDRLSTPNSAVTRYYFISLLFQDIVSLIVSICNSCVQTGHACGAVAS